MRSKRIPAEEQYRLIMECRQSGLTDHQWCVEHDIKPGTFYDYSAVRIPSIRTMIPAIHCSSSAF